MAEGTHSYYERAKAKNATCLIDLQPSMKARYNRGNLEVGISYIQVNNTGRKPVGKFISTDYQGSGDGMEIIVIFELDGKQNIIREDMWGSLSGDELSYFEKA
jgi:hypothetical protein